MNLFSSQEFADALEGESAVYALVIAGVIGIALNKRSVDAA